MQIMNFPQPRTSQRPIFSNGDIKKMIITLIENLNVVNTENKSKCLSAMLPLITLISFLSLSDYLWIKSNKVQHFIFRSNIPDGVGS